MPRQGRLHIPGAYYHVMGRGLERRNIFATDEDKELFISRLADGINKNDIVCVAWALMSNHYCKQAFKFDPSFRNWPCNLRGINYLVLSVHK